MQFTAKGGNLFHAVLWKTKGNKQASPERHRFVAFLQTDMKSKQKLRSDKNKGTLRTHLEKQTKRKTGEQEAASREKGTKEKTKRVH